MRIKIFLFVPVALIALCIHSTASAKPVPPAIAARYKTLVAIVERYDLKAYDALIPAEYVSIDPKGKKSNRAEYLAGIHDLLRNAKKVVFHIKFTDVEQRNGIVAVSFDCDGQIITSKGTTFFHEIGTDSWRKKGSQWREVKTVDRLMKITTPQIKTR